MIKTTINFNLPNLMKKIAVLFAFVMVFVAGYVMGQRSGSVSGLRAGLIPPWASSDSSSILSSLLNPPGSSQLSDSLAPVLSAFPPSSSAYSLPNCPQGKYICGMGCCNNGQQCLEGGICFTLPSSPSSARASQPNSNLR